MEDLQKKLDKLIAERQELVEKAGQQIAWMDGKIAQLRELLNPEVEKENEDKPSD